MKEKIELSRFREFGDIISDTFVIIKQNFKPLLKAYIVIGGLFLVANILVSIVVNQDKGESPLLTPMGLLELFFDFINYTTLLLTTLSYLVVYKEKGNQPPEVVEVWSYFKYYFFRVFLMQILLSALALIGFFICFVPGVYLSIVFALVTPIMVAENGSINYSFNKAFKLIKEYWWFTFGILLLITIIVFMAMLVLLVPPMIFYGGSEWLTGKDLGRSAAIIQAIIVNVCQFLWLIPVTSSALIYFSLSEEKEAGSLINRIKMFGKSGAGADELSSEQY